MSNYSKGVILVVDDTPANLRLLTEMLNKSGYHVRSAINGEVALMSAFANPPDLILLDIRMPDMDGYTVCRRLKASPVTQDIPIIFISALNQTEDIVRAFEAGGVDYVPKPFRFREVQARVDNQLTLARQRREIEELREKDRQSFISLSKMKEQFIGAATHDLKNPLFNINGYATMLMELDGVRGDESAQEYIIGIKRAIEKILMLVTDMLDIAQTEIGVEMAFEPVPLGDFIAALLPEFNVTAGQKQITLSYEAPAEPVTVSIDRQRMEQVVENLVSNAIKYTPAGGRVEVTCGAEDGQAYFRVSDNGLGIPDDALPYLFDAFYRVRLRQHREIEGTGLGLAIVKSIVDQHAGEILVSSELGAGSDFVVRLPVWQEYAPAAEEA